ncbi:hypothetical protein CRYUN_Cryun12cG0058700 [Craigia yunnanensis]
MQAMKRIPRVKFPQRHAKPSGSGLQSQSATKTGDGDLTFFSGSKASATVGGKASLQPKKTPVSNDEIEAILVCKILIFSWVAVSDHLVELNEGRQFHGLLICVAHSFSYLNIETSISNDSGVR